MTVAFIVIPSLDAVVELKIIAFGMLCTVSPFMALPFSSTAGADASGAGEGDLPVLVLMGRRRGRMLLRPGEPDLAVSDQADEKVGRHAAVDLFGGGGVLRRPAAGEHP